MVEITSKPFLSFLKCKKIELIKKNNKIYAKISEQYLQMLIEEYKENKKEVNKIIKGC